MLKNFYSIHEFVSRHRAIFFLLLLPWTVFFLLLWSQMLRFDQTGLWAGHPWVWADWSLHIGLAQSFVERPMSEWFANHLLYTGVPLNYPFVTNLISAMLILVGFSLTAAFLLPSLLFSVALLVTLIFFFRSQTKNVSQWVIAAWLFLCSGGLGFLYVTKEKLFDSLVTLTQLPAQRVEFTSVLMGMLVPQRAFLLGMPLGLLVLSQVTQILNGKKSVRLFVVSGILAGLLPIIHTHTFLVVVMMSAWLFVCSLAMQKKILFSWFAYGVPAGIVSLSVYTVFLHSTVSQSTFFTWNPGWYVQTGLIDWFVFWLKNWGVFGLLAIVGTFFFAIHKKKIPLLVAFGWWAIFIVANLMKFQPQSWDNSKIFAWVYVGLALPAAYILVVLWRKHMVTKLIAILLFCLSIFSGGLDVIHMLDFSRKTHQLLNTKQVELATFVRTNTPTSAVFLTADWVTNPVTILGGRSIVLGYTGWIFNYGFPYQEREQEIAAFYADPTKNELLKKYNVSYVLVGEHERKYSPDTATFDRLFRSVFSNESGTIYEVSRDEK